MPWKPNNAFRGHCWDKCRWSQYKHIKCCTKAASKVNSWHRVMLSSVECPALLYFSTLSHKQDDFRKEVLQHKIVFWCSLKFCLRQSSYKEFSETLPSFKALVILLRFESNFNFLFSSNIPEISNFMKIRPVGAEFFFGDWQPCLTKLLFGFRIPRLHLKSGMII